MSRIRDALRVVIESLNNQGIPVPMQAIKELDLQDAIVKIARHVEEHRER